MNLRSFPWRWLLFALCAFTFGLAPFKQAVDTASERFSGLKKADWATVNFWIEAADCARKTGAFLAICKDNRLFPIANYALGDDPGPALFLGLKARMRNRPMNMVDVAKLNILINFISLLFISMMFFMVRSYVASLVMIMLGGPLYSSWIAVSPHPALIGAASMAFILPSTILLAEGGSLRGVVRIIFIACGLILLGLASLLREPIGTMGFFVSVGVLVYVGLRRFQLGSKWWRLIILLPLVFIAWQIPRGILLVRDAYFPMEPTNMIQTHGISHNLYLGLGAVKNKFGIIWDDMNAAEAVRKVNPDVPYVSRDYYRILWSLYWERVFSDPAEVVRIYTVKLRKMLRYRMPERWLPLWLTLIGIAAFMVWGYRQHVWHRLHYEQGPSYISVALAFIGFFLAQGAVAHHSQIYAFPISGFVVLCFAVSLEVFFRIQYQKGMPEREEQSS